MEHKKLKGNLTEKEADLQNLKKKGRAVGGIVSQYDGHLVEDQISNVERKFNEALQKTKRQLDSYEAVSTNYETLTREMEEHTAWLRAKEKLLLATTAMGYHVKNAEDALTEHNSLSRDIESRQVSVDGFSRKGELLYSELKKRECNLIKKRITLIQSEHQKLLDLANQKKKQLSSAVAVRSEFHQSYERVSQWLTEKEQALNQLGGAVGHLERCKALLTEVKAYEPNIENTKSIGRELQHQCDANTIAELVDKIHDIQKRHDQLKVKLQDHINKGRDAITARRQLDTDLGQVDECIARAQTVCASQIQPDWSIPVLEEQTHAHRNVHNTCQNMDSLMKEVIRRMETVLPDLNEQERSEVKEKINKTKSQLQSISGQVKDRLLHLEEAVSTKAQVEAALNNCNQWIAETRSEFKVLTGPIGIGEGDAHVMLHKCQNLKENVINYKPNIENLKSHRAEMVDSGHLTIAEQIDHTGATYEQMIEQLSQQQVKLGQAAHLRDQFFFVRGEVEEALKTAKDQLHFVNAPGVSTPAKLDRYKSVHETLQTVEPQMALLESRVHQIIIDTKPEDAQVLKDKLQDIKDKNEELKKDVANHKKEFEQMMAERHVFDKDLEKSIDWLKQKAAIVASRGPLPVDPESIDSDLRKHANLSREVLPYLQNVFEQINEQKAMFDQFDEPIPLVLQDKIDEFDDLKATLSAGLHERENFLKQAQSERVQFFAALQSLTNWVKDAEGHLQSDYDGFDFEKLPDQLEEQKAVCEEVPQHSVEMEALLAMSSKLQPTLDVNDKTTMKQTVANLSERLDALREAADQQKNAQKYLQDYQTFQDKVAEMTTALTEAEQGWETADRSEAGSLTHARSQLQDIQEYNHSLAKCRTLFDDITQRGHDLDRIAGSNSRSVIGQKLSALSERWNKLNMAAEETEETLLEMVSEWEGYEDSIQHMKAFIQGAEDRMMAAQVEKLSPTEMQNQLQVAQALCGEVEQNQPHLSTAKRKGQSVVYKLPTGQAKVGIQEELAQIQDRFEKLQVEAQQHQQSLEREVEMQREVVAEMCGTSEIIENARRALQDGCQDIASMDPEEVEQQLAKQIAQKEEVSRKLAQVRKAIADYRAKYGDDAPLPAELLEQLAQLEQLEAQLEKEIAEKTEKLAQVKKMRQDYAESSVILHTWMDEAEMQINQGVAGVHEANFNHKELVAEIPQIEAKMRNLQTTAQEIASEISDPIERSAFLKEVTDMEERLSKLKAQAADKSKQLSTAVELQQNFDVTIANLSKWLDRAEPLINQELVLNNPVKVRTQLREYKASTIFSSKSSDFNYKMDQLNKTIESLREFCDTSDAMTKLSEISRRCIYTQNVVDERLDKLQNALPLWEEYESKAGEVRQWLDDVRRRLDDLEGTDNLKAQFDQNEEILAEMETNQSKMAALLAKQEELRTYINDYGIGDGNKLANEMQRLKMAVEAQNAELHDAALLQDAYHSEVRQLSRLVEDAQRKISSAPVVTSSLDQLKRQLAEHHALSCQIDTFKQGIDNLQEKSRHLARVTEITPISTRLHGDDIPVSMDTDVTVSDTDLVAIGQSGELPSSLSLADTSDSGVLTGSSHDNLASDVCHTDSDVKPVESSVRPGCETSASVLSDETDIVVEDVNTIECPDEDTALEEGRHLDLNKAYDRPTVSELESEKHQVTGYDSVSPEMIGDETSTDDHSPTMTTSQSDVAIDSLSPMTISEQSETLSESQAQETGEQEVEEVYGSSLPLVLGENNMVLDTPLMFALEKIVDSDFEQGQSGDSTEHLATADQSSLPEVKADQSDILAHNDTPKLKTSQSDTNIESFSQKSEPEQLETLTISKSEMDDQPSEEVFGSSLPVVMGESSMALDTTLMIALEKSVDTDFDEHSTYQSADDTKPAVTTEVMTPSHSEDMNREIDPQDGATNQTLDEVQGQPCDLDTQSFTIMHSELNEVDSILPENIDREALGCVSPVSVEEDVIVALKLEKPVASVPNVLFSAQNENNKSMTDANVPFETSDLLPKANLPIEEQTALSCEETGDTAEGQYDMPQITLSPADNAEISNSDTLPKAQADGALLADELPKDQTDSLSSLGNQTQPTLSLLDLDVPQYRGRTYSDASSIGEEKIVPEAKPSMSKAANIVLGLLPEVPGDHDNSTAVDERESTEPGQVDGDQEEQICEDLPLSAEGSPNNVTGQLSTESEDVYIVESLPAVELTEDEVTDTLPVSQLAKGESGCVLENIDDVSEFTPEKASTLSDKNLPSDQESLPAIGLTEVEVTDTLPVSELAKGESDGVLEKLDDVSELEFTGVKAAKCSDESLPSDQVISITQTIDVTDLLSDHTSEDFEEISIEDLPKSPMSETDTDGADHEKRTYAEVVAGKILDALGFESEVKRDLTSQHAPAEPQSDAGDEVERVARMQVLMAVTMGAQKYEEEMRQMDDESNGKDQIDPESNAETEENLKQIDDKEQMVDKSNAVSGEQICDLHSVGDLDSQKPMKPAIESAKCQEMGEQTLDRPAAVSDVLLEPVVTEQSGGELDQSDLDIPTTSSLSVNLPALSDSDDRSLARPATAADITLDVPSDDDDNDRSKEHQCCKEVAMMSPTETTSDIGYESEGSIAQSHVSDDSAFTRKSDGSQAHSHVTDDSAFPCKSDSSQAQNYPSDQSSLSSEKRVKKDPVRTEHAQEGEMSFGLAECQPAGELDTASLSSPSDSAVLPVVSSESVKLARNIPEPCQQKEICVNDPVEQVINAPENTDEFKANIETQADFSLVPQSEVVHSHGQYAFDDLNTGPFDIQSQQNLREETSDIRKQEPIITITDMGEHADSAQSALVLPQIQSPDATGSVSESKPIPALSVCDESKSSGVNTAEGATERSTAEAMEWFALSPPETATNGSTQPGVSGASRADSAFGTLSPGGVYDNSVQDLNTSYNTLQMQVSARERELREALQRHEEYQDSVQEVMARLDNVQSLLSDHPPSPAADVDQQIMQHQDILDEILLLEKTIAEVKSKGRALTDSSDLQGQKAMESTLTMLDDKLSALKAQARIRGEELETMRHDKESHRKTLSEYTVQVRQFEDWLAASKLVHEGEPLITSSPELLQNQLESAQSLQRELSDRLRQLSDLTVQCEKLAEYEPPSKAEKLRSDLAALQADTAQFKLSMLQKQDQLKDALKESEKRARELAEFSSSVENLQRWMEQHKHLGQAPLEGATEVTGMSTETEKLQKQLEADFAEHQELLRAVSRRARQVVSGRGGNHGDEDTEPGLEEIKANWAILSQQLADRKSKLQDIINNDRPQDFVGRPMQYYRSHSYGGVVREPHVGNKAEDACNRITELKRCWTAMEEQVADKQGRLEQTLAFQQRYQDAMAAISHWLDDVEIKLFGPGGADRSAEEQIRDSEALQKEIAALQNEISTMNEASQRLMSAAGSESRNLIQQTVGDLNERLESLEKQARIKESMLQQRNEEWKQYQSDVHKLLMDMAQLQQKFALMAVSSASLQQQQLDNKKLHEQLRECEHRLDELTRRGEELASADPSLVLPVEMNSLQNSWLDLQHMAGQRQTSLERAVTIQTQYEKVIEEYAEFLETAQTKLRQESVSASDLPHLQSQLTAHKEFFNDLESHRAMLDTLAQKVDRQTRQLYMTSHTRLSSLTHVIQDRASVRGQKLEHLVQQWTQFDQQFASIATWLQVIKSKMPLGLQGDESLRDIVDKIGVYHALQRQIADEKTTVHQVLHRGRLLLQNMACPTLENVLADFAEDFMAVNSNINAHCRRLESLIDQSEKFGNDAAEFEKWLMTAEEKLNVYGNVDERDIDNINVINSRINKFLEFRKEVENHTPMKVKVLNEGSLLLRSRPLDVDAVQQRMTSMEDRWMQLVHSIPASEEQLHQLQMELLPSRQALNEILAWMDEAEKTLAGDSKQTIINLRDVLQFVKKYRFLKIDMANRQMTVDFVNQSSLNMSTSQLDTQQSDKTDFAERLGQMNNRWQRISSDVAGRLKNLELIQVKWDEFEMGIKALQDWYHDNDLKVKRHNRLGHEVTIQQSLKECKGLIAELPLKANEIEAIKQIGSGLCEERGVPRISGVALETAIESVNHQAVNLDHQVTLAINSLEDALQQWDDYHALLELVNETLTETDYSLKRFNTISGDASALNVQVQQLKALGSDFEKNRSQLSHLDASAKPVLSSGEPDVCRTVNQAVQEAKDKWSKISAQLAATESRFNRILLLWQQYESQYEQERKWIEVKEKETDKLIGEKGERESRLAIIEQCADLIKELEDFEPRFEKLVEKSEFIKSNMDSTTIIHLNSRQKALQDNMQMMHHLLSKHMQHLQTDHAQKSRFDDCLATVETFLQHAERTLQKDDPHKNASEDLLLKRLDELKALLLEFSHNQANLDAVNDLGYRLPLNDADSERLKRLNRGWQTLNMETADRHRTIQSHALLQQDFHQKCEMWMEFVEGAERDMSAPIGGNNEQLLVQQKQCDIFLADVYSKQQILYSIISDGQQMLRYEHVEDAIEFQHKLTQLNEQWLTIVRRANDKKTIIDSCIRRWHAHHGLEDKISDWLSEMEDRLSRLECDTAPLQMIKSMLEMVKVNQREVTQKDPLYRSVLESGRTLMNHSDRKTQQEIQEGLSRIQQRWLHLIGQLDSKHIQLEGVLKQWLHCEADIEDTLTWLKGIRNITSVDIPDRYDDLQNDLQQCKEFETTFCASEDKKNTLSVREKQLSERVSADDISILHQRIILLNKQWVEIEHQVSLRKHLVLEKLNRWSQFSDRYREMCDWLGHMEVKVTSNGDTHIEDLLLKLEREYREEMSRMDAERQALIADGHRLMRNSSEIRATDIEYKISKLTDKWQKLEAMMANRVKKLHETLAAVHQLEVNMSELRAWLARIEHDLSSPISYQSCDMKEIQRQLQTQQDLQREIDRQSTGVLSVLNLCEVLLHDSDACPTQLERGTLQKAAKSLDKRWRNICNMSMERRLRIEETWKLWQKFHDEFIKFDGFLSACEKASRNPKTHGVTLGVARQEMYKYEDMQHKLHETLHQLEALNKSYRHLARENRTDAKGHQKSQIHSINERWDELSKRLAAILKRLKHMLDIHADFQATKEGLLIWLTDLDVRLTNLEHVTDTDVDAKLRQMKKIQENVEENQSRLCYMDEVGDYLLQKSEAIDAVRVQRDLDEFHGFSSQVLKRVTKLSNRLNKASQSKTDYFDGKSPEKLGQSKESLRKSRAALSRSKDSLSKSKESLSKSKEAISRSRDSLAKSKDALDGALTPRRSPYSSPSPQKADHVSPLRDSVKSRNPASVQSNLHQREPTGSHLSMDWDMYDVQPAPTAVSNKNKQAKKDGESWSAAKERMARKQQKLSRSEERILQLKKAVVNFADQMTEFEKDLRCTTPVGADADKMKKSYTSQVMRCQESVDHIQTLQDQLQDLIDADVLIKVEGVLERWQVLQAQALEKDARLLQSSHQWQQFQADIASMMGWLAEAEKTQASHVKVPADIELLEIAIRKHKEFLLQLEHRKAIVLSINVLSQRFSDGDTHKSRKVRDQLHTLNQRWNSITSKSSSWQRKLQRALMQCGDFHQTIRELLLWLESIEMRIRYNEPEENDVADTKSKKYAQLMELKAELETTQPRVTSLKDTADQLLLTTDSQDAADAKEKLTIIAHRLKTLLKMCMVCLTRLEGATDIGRLAPTPIKSKERPLSARHSGSSRLTSTPRSSKRLAQKQLLGQRAVSMVTNEQLDPDNFGRRHDGLSELEAGRIHHGRRTICCCCCRGRRRGVCSRICCAALPLQLLMLLLLGIACLIPITEEDYNCLMTNNLGRTFHTLLRYRDGPPPT